MRASARAALASGLLAASLALSACQDQPEPLERVQRGIALKDPSIRESSGLAASDRHDGVLYTHNDQGHPPVVFAVAADGTTAAELRLRGSEPVDWEDIAVADGRVWVGDIGGAGTVRTTVSVLVFDEPAELTDAEPTWERIELAYPDGAHDAEALLVHPDTARIYVVTKDAQEAGIYAAPEQLERGPNVLTKVDDAPPNITGGDFAPSDDVFALRNTNRAFLFPYLGRNPRVVELPDQDRGESLVFGDAELLVGSEGIGATILNVPLRPDLVLDLFDATATGTPPAVIGESD